MSEDDVTTQDIEELRGAVVSLASRVTNLSASLNTVNELQARQQDLEIEARTAREKAEKVEEVLVPREEHEEHWRREAQGLIDLRLHIRFQTFVLGLAFFIVSVGILVFAIHTVHTEQARANHNRISECQQRKDSSQQSLAAYAAITKAHPEIRTQEPGLAAVLDAVGASATRITQVVCK